MDNGDDDEWWMTFDLVWPAYIVEWKLAFYNKYASADAQQRAAKVTITDHHDILKFP